MPRSAAPKLDPLPNEECKEKTARKTAPLAMLGTPETFGMNKPITSASTISRAYTLGCHCSSIWPATSRCLRRKRTGRAYRSRRRSRRDLLCRHRKRRLGLRCAGGGGERPRDESRLRRRGEVAGGHESERGADLFD